MKCVKVYIVGHISVSITMRRFLLSGTVVPYIMVCKNSLSCVIGFEIDLWNTLIYLVDIGAFEPKVHGLTGNTGKNQLSPEMNIALRDFFQRTYEFLEPRDTQVVQDNLDTSLTCGDD